MRSGGFPDGVRWTPLPDLFFSRHMPEMSNPVALKVLLHVVWRLHRRPRGAPPALQEHGIKADPIVRRGCGALGVADSEVAEAIATAIGELLDRSLLLEAWVAAELGPERWLFVNGREGRAALRRWQSGGLVLPAEAVAEPGADVQTSIFVLYEQNIGPLTPLLAEELADAEANYPAEWIEEAFRLAVVRNARSWAYVRAVLDRWGREGREHETHRRDPQAARGRDTEGPYAAYVKH